MHRMNPVKESEALYVREDTLDKVISNATFLKIVEFRGALDVLSSIFEDKNASHHLRRLFSSEVVKNPAFPAAAFDNL